MAGTTTTGDTRGITWLRKPRVKPNNQTTTTTTTVTQSTEKEKGIGYDIGRGIGALKPKELRKRKNQGLDFE